MQKTNNTSKSLIKEMDMKVIVPSMVIVFSLIIYCVLNEETALATFSTFFDSFVIQFTSLYVWYPIVLIGMGLFYIFSKYGNIVLGKADEKPAISTFKYVAIILAMAFGSTIMRTGVINWASAAGDPAFGIDPFSPEALIYGNSYSMFTWGFAVFAIFGLAAPTIGYYMHVRKKTSIKLSAILSEVFGEKFKTSFFGKLADLIFVVAFVCGGATCVGFATPVVAAVVANLVGIDASLQVEIALTMLIVIIFTISCMLGLKKGIEKLSEFNIYMAIVFIILVLILGPTLFIIDFFTDTVGHLLNNYVNFSFYANSMSDTTDHLQSYTVFWSAYNAGWAILHSSFLAIISKGRTIRQMLVTYFIAPQIIVVIFTAVLGGLGVNSLLAGNVAVFDLLAEIGTGGTVTKILETLPLNTIMMIIYVVLSITFLSTTMDSYTYTGASYITMSDISSSEPSKAIRLMWAVLIAVMAITMMIVGGLAPLEVINGIIGIPMMVVQGFVIYAGIKMMNEDKAYIHNVRKKDFDA